MAETAVPQPLEQIMYVIQLRNEKIVVASEKGQGTIFLLPTEEFISWKNIFCWLFLGHTDQHSAFGCMPKEVLFHFIYTWFS